ncbi:F0F1 ATP synthase subunit delta [Acidipropionibacterium virtanenii]|uniref:ATP synthase subunit delta n=1 Tax=Acidipropionibacterium virtanenii TaxID=2057246 RepID=A0A344UTV7_9ACTN|nr:F0F1 ATP synthase subunit delta [Acidipropionibacterium virtanenii]AXE38705.1 ATP synthase subunit b-delta [Acidipropionibacterium virtanenii]
MSSSTGGSGALSARLAALDSELDSVPSSQQLSDDLFGVVDLLDGNSGLRRAISDPAVNPAARTRLTHRLLEDRIGPEALRLVDRALEIGWAGPAQMTRGLEQAGVRSELRTAQGAGAGVDVEDELFRFGQTVRADPALSLALSDADQSVTARRGLVSGLLEGRCRPESVVLAARAVRATKASYTDVLDGYVRLSARMRDEQVAVVTTARGLSAEQRTEILRQLDRITGRRVDLKEAVDPTVLGGARISFGDEVIDGTVARRLDQARRTLG